MITFVSCGGVSGSAFTCWQYVIVTYWCVSVCQGTSPGLLTERRFYVDNAPAEWLLVSFGLLYRPAFKRWIIRWLLILCEVVLSCERINSNGQSLLEMCPTGWKKRMLMGLLSVELKYGSLLTAVCVNSFALSPTRILVVYVTYVSAQAPGSAISLKEWLVTKRQWRTSPLALVPPVGYNLW